MLGLCDPFLAGSPRSDWPQRPPWTPGTPGENLAGSLLPVCFILTHLPFAPPPIFMVCVSVCACVFTWPTCGGQVLFLHHVDPWNQTQVIRLGSRASTHWMISFPLSLFSFLCTMCTIMCVSVIACTTMQMKRESPRTVRSLVFFTCLRAFLCFFYCVLGASWPASFSSPCRGLQKLMLPVRLLHESGNLNSDPHASAFTASAFTH